MFIHFFSFTMFPPASSITSTAVYGIGILMLITSFIGLVLKKNFRSNPMDYKVSLFIVSIIISSFMANLYWDQLFAMSLKGYIYFYIYALYFFLVLLDVSSERVEFIFKLFFFSTLIVFLIDFITFPNPLFSWRSEERRDGITIFFFGQGFTFLGAFYYLNSFFLNKKVHHLLWFLIAAFCLFYLTQSRMNLLALIAGFFILLLSSDVKRKYLIAIFILALGAIIYFSSGVFNGIKDASADQAEYYKEDIRLMALNYFIFDHQGGISTIIFGNGVPFANSSLGLASEKAAGMGFWTADLGLIGIFSYFGILGVVVWLFFFYSVFTMKNSRNVIYLKVYFVTLLTTAFVAYAIFEPGFMPATILALYLVRCHTNVDPVLSE